MYHLRYQKSSNTFYVEAVGEVDAMMLFDALECICHHSNLQDDLRIITDYRKAKINKDKAKNIDIVASYIIKYLIPNFKNIQWGSIALDYISTTAFLIIKELLKGHPIQYETFTTEARICEWINVETLNNEDYNTFHKEIG